MDNYSNSFEIKNASLKRVLVYKYFIQNLVDNLIISREKERQTNYTNFVFFILYTWLHILLFVHSFFSFFIRLKFKQFANSRIGFIGTRFFSYGINAEKFYYDNQNKSKKISIIEPVKLISVNYFKLKHSEKKELLLLLRIYTLHLKRFKFSKVSFLLFLPSIINNLALILLLRREKKRFSVFFSLPSALEQMPALSFSKTSGYHIIHLFHGRSNGTSYNSYCDLALVKVDEDILKIRQNSLINYRHVIKRKTYLSLVKEQNMSNNVLYLHGYRKGESKFYNFNLLLKDINILNGIINENKNLILYILVHPTAFLFIFYIKFVCLFNSHIRICDSSKIGLNDYKLIYSSSPTCNLELLQFGLAFKQLNI